MLASIAGIVSFIKIYFNIAKTGMPIIAFNPKDFIQKDKTKMGKSISSVGGKDNSQKETKSVNKEPTMIIGTPIFFSNIHNYCFNKVYKRKQNPFTEREGDWICNNCKNLNFSFRVECNRCKLPKDSNSKMRTNEENNINDKENKKEQKLLQHNKKNYNHKKNNN
jgi:hypothetical protein